MRIEHFGYQVKEPDKVADWYCEHLGFEVKRASDTPVPVRFLADVSGKVMIEIYNNPKAPIPDYTAMDPLVLHIAFVCPEVAETAKRLTTVGATIVSGHDVLENGDELAMLRDPWGLAIQLAKRGKPMI